jgi:flagellar P-ring protein precursor FlgI
VPEQASLQDLVQALNTLGVTPRDLVAIIQALKETGALEAELVIQ